jgi:NADH-quinone oxidoreductase subunit F
MDLRPIPTEPTLDEREVVDALLGPEQESPPRPLSYARSERHRLLPVLHAIQDRVGWISAGALGYACRRLEVPAAEGYGVASFYSLLSLSERPAILAHVCEDLTCKLAGADALAADLERRVGPAGERWARSPCLGLCDKAPAVLVTSAGPEPTARAWGPASADGVQAALDGGPLPDGDPTILGDPGAAPLRLLRRVGKVDPASLDDYRAHGGYVALRRALELGPSAVLREIIDAKLLGRGGAAFPTGLKWQAVAREVARPHYLVCNADESEPGTFKDRVLLEEDPFAIIEAMTIAAMTIGAERGFLYVRGEYPLAIDRLTSAVSQARIRGFLGRDILGRGLDFDLEIRRGGGAYICGEETALLSSIEGLRGEPRNKPPFPTQRGLFGKPTCVNNVETLLNVLGIVTDGAEAFRSLGTADSTGTRLFCVSGSIRRPGLYELPLGVRLSELIERAGGVPVGRRIQAILLGGAAGTFLGSDELELPLTFEDARRAGVSLGSGVVLVLDDTVDLIRFVQRIARFFRDESCGQCVPCRVGTVRQDELIVRLAAKTPLGSLSQERRLLREMGQAMRDASICGLGQTATSAVESAVAKLALLGEEGGHP